ncbi:phage tail protein [Streptomyces sp. NPDC058683]|uniref:phage tail protein n=1 Tax=Streptomyces sp. NPDC058683 TaxID=3346597 RepID=UPI00364CDB2C
MDVQGSQYHVVNGMDDWGRCTDAASGRTLSDAWSDTAPATDGTAWEYDPDLGVLRLRRDTPLFRRAARTPPLAPDIRRGSGRDTYGNWYWIDADRRTIRGRAVSARAASTWWSVDDLADNCACRSAEPGTFTHSGACPPVDILLQGLAVTTHQYLLVGYRGRQTPCEAGLLVFDLRGGGAPLRLPWPDGDAFDPWDLADTADGGVLVLDATHSAYWRLDEHFRLRGREEQQTTSTAEFGPVGGTPAPPATGPAVPEPWPLADAEGNPLHAVAIEPGPDGSVLVLDADPGRGHSTLYRFDGGRLRWTTPLQDVVEVVDPRDPTNTPTLYSLLGHDFCYLAGPPATGPLPPPVLYVADAEGAQVIAFDLDPDTGTVRAHDDFLPMRRWAGRALVRSGAGAWYDFGERWISLEVFNECRFATTATLVTAVDTTGTVPGDTFDSRLPGCVWHRLLLDAQVPTGTGVTVRARADDDPALLSLRPWLDQPAPYRRSGGPELPWTDVWADRRQPDGTLPDATGTWELLFQGVTGRYLQLEITLTGTGRSSPLLRSLRAWYPRFSYPEHYLPEVYTGTQSPDRFLERFLANPEGLYTAIEERIEHTHLLLDARTAPTADLPWLAAWFGLALDPLWDTERRRFLIRHVDTFYRRRGTVPGLVATLRVFLDPVVDERIFDPVGECGGAAATTGIRVVERFLTRDAAAPAPGTADDDPRTRVRRFAHRFDVLVPGDLSADAAAMVTRIVAAAKPGHTAFEVSRFQDLFVIGRARLGIDTQVVAGPSFTPIVTGSGVLAAGYLGYAHPFDITDRVVSDRDRIGALHAL